jgi:hypothetical protein
MASFENFCLFMYASGHVMRVMVEDLAMGILPTTAPTHASIMLYLTLIVADECEEFKAVGDTGTYCPVHDFQHPLPLYTCVQTSP